MTLHTLVRQIRFVRYSSTTGTPQAAIKQDDHAVVVEETAQVVVGLKGLRPI